MVIPASVLLRETAERGYDGGISQLKASLAQPKAPEPELWCASRRHRASRCWPTSHREPLLARDTSACKQVEAELKAQNDALLERASSLH